jgi:phage gp46-like protein
MTDIRYLQQADFPRYAVELDWLLNDQNLIEDGYSLQSAIIIALGSDALAGASDPLPNLDDDDRRGWWGDLDAEELWGGWPVGSKLWLLRRAKITSPLAPDGGTVFRAQSYTRAAIDPFVARLIASSADVGAERTDVSRIDVSVTLYRGPEPAVELRYAELWDELGNA